MTQVRTSTLKQEEKPLLRGWLHVFGALAAVAFTAHLVTITGEDAWSILLFGLATVALFGVSATYHLGDGHWSKPTAKVMRKLDHCTIFLFIASTITPFCELALEGTAHTVMLTTIWVFAVGGVAVTLPSWRVPRWLKTGLYVAMGWSAAGTFPMLVGRFDWWPVLLVVLGGVLYTVGAVVYARKRPNPVPGVFGFHEVFHLFTLAANAVFSAVIYIWLVPLT